MLDWADTEFEALDVGDRRRRDRTIKTARTLAEHPGESIPQACASWPDTEGAYRLFENEHVSAQAILDEHFRHSALRAAEEPRVVVLADGSELDFTSLKVTTGLGHLSNENRRGLDVFAVLVANLSGQPLGLIDAKIWARDLATKGKSKDRRKRPTEEKESQFWLDGLARAQERLPEGLPFLYIADSEADMFDLLAAPRRDGVHVLVRACHGHVVDDPAHLLDRAIGSVDPCGRITVEVGRGGNRPAPRSAELTLRFKPLWVLAPQGSVPRKVKKAHIYVVLADEAAPPDGVEPIRWLLLTTLPVTTENEARRRTTDYARRWLVERYFYTLKTGCRVEELQLGTAEQLVRAASLFSVVAWRLLWLMHESRIDPHVPCTSLMSDYEWMALYAYHYPTMKLPRKPPTLREAVHLTAKLGGYLGRRNDGDPGIKTLWTGLAILERLATLYRSLAENPALCQSSEI